MAPQVTATAPRSPGITFRDRPNVATKSPSSSGGASSLLGWQVGILTTLFVVTTGIHLYLFAFWKPDVESQVQKGINAAISASAEHSDEMLDFTTDVAVEVSPELMAAFNQQINKDLNTYAAISREQGEVLAQNLEATLSNRMDGLLEKYLDRHQQVAAEEFPEYASKEELDTLVRSYRKAATKLMKRYYIDEFRVQTGRSLDLWYQFKPMDEKTFAEVPRHKLLLDYFADWALLTAKDQAVVRINVDE